MAGAGANSTQEAIELYRRVLAISERRFGPKHLDVAICLNNLGKSLGDQNKHAEAEPYYRRALDVLT